MNQRTVPMLVSDIQDEFNSRGWYPLLPVNTRSLKDLDQAMLRDLVERVRHATDRLAALNEILSAIKPHD